MAVTQSCRSAGPCLVIAVFALGLSSGLLPNHTTAETAPPGRGKAPAGAAAIRPFLEQHGSHLAGLPWPAEPKLHGAPWPSPVGRTLVPASSDSTALVWDLP
jgi:hypothetical protein